MNNKKAPHPPKTPLGVTPLQLKTSAPDSYRDLRLCEKQRLPSAPDSYRDLREPHGPEKRNTDLADATDFRGLALLTLFASNKLCALCSR